MRFPALAAFEASWLLLVGVSHSVPKPPQQGEETLKKIYDATIPLIAECDVLTCSAQSNRATPALRREEPSKKLSRLGSAANHSSHVATLLLALLGAER